MNSRLRFLCATQDVYLLISIAEQNLVGIDADCYDLAAKEHT